MSPHLSTAGGIADRPGPRLSRSQHAAHPTAAGHAPNGRHGLRLDSEAARCAAELAAEVTGIHLTGVALFDTEGCLKMQAVFGHRTQTWAELTIPGASIAHRVRRTGRVACLSNYARESGCAPWLIDMFCGGEGAVALAAVPLRLGQDVIGVLYGGVREPIEIGDRVLYALDRVARLTSATAWNPAHPMAAAPVPEADGLPMPELTLREREMLVLLADGVSTREIAERTGLTINSVRTYIQSTLTKLGAGSRLEAVARGRALELV